MKKTNSNKVILNLCGGSGAWSKPYKDAGYRVILITLPEYDILKTTWDKEYFWFMPSNRKYVLKVAKKDIYGILAAPPCTEFSKAKSTMPRDFALGMETIEACLRIIWEAQKDHKLAFWALENPMGLLRRFLGDPPYNFDQWWFGEDKSKNTDLWGKFEKPRRKIFTKPATVQGTKGYMSKDGQPLANRNSRWYANASAAQRAITPPGFAKAFFKANQ